MDGTPQGTETDKGHLATAVDLVLILVHAVATARCRGATSPQEYPGKDPTSPYRNFFAVRSRKPLPQQPRKGGSQQPAGLLIRSSPQTKAKP